MGLLRQPTPHGPAALAALRAAVDAAQCGQPLAPVTVIVPSNSVGVAARRWLAAHGGLAAVRFVTMYRLAELLGGPVLTAGGARPVSTPVVDVAVRQSIEQAAGMFQPVAHHHATVDALRNAHRELRHLPARVVDRLGEHGSDRAREVVALHRRITRVLADGWYDEADLSREAVRLIRNPSFSAANHIGGVVVFLPQRLRPTEQRLLDALGSVGEVRMITGAVPTAGFGDHPDAPGAVDVLDLSDADEEAREVVRQIVAAAAAGTSFERIGVFWPNVDPYARLLTEHLTSAGIPWNGRPGIELHERLAARLLLDVLGLDRRGLRRADLFAALAHVPARQPDGNRVPAQHWERLSREAAIAVEADWEGRLAQFQRNLEQDPERTADAAAIRAMRTFVADLRERLGPPDQRSPWHHWADLCEHLLHRWLGGHRQIAALPTDEHDAYMAVQGAVDRLGRLDEIDEPVTRQTFLETLAAELDASPGRAGRLGVGVQVGPLSYALGQSLDLVIVMGACEGQLPAPPPVEPLLGDADRALTEGGLPLSGEWLHEQRTQFLAALATAPRAVVLMPRGDMRATALRRPSRWVLELVAATALTRRSVPSFAAGLADTPFPATPTEHRIRALAHHVRGGATIDTHPLIGSAPALGGGLRLLRAREQPTFTEFDGDLTGVRIASPLDGLAAISPTRLERWALCPFAYFVMHVLRIQPIEQPDSQWTITPADRGNMVHETLDRFHRLVLAGDLPPAAADGWGDVHRAALLDVYESVGGEFADAGKVGRLAFWAADRVRVRNELLAWLDLDSRRLVERGATLVHSEYAFGLDTAPAATIALPSGRLARLKGKVDRIDRAVDGTLFVTDHKTGSASSFGAIAADDPTAGGTKLQLPAYAAAALAMVGAGSTAAGSPPVHAEYSFFAKGKYGRPGYTFTEDVWPQVGAAIERLVDGIEAGWFFAVPEKSQFRKSWVSCEFCDPDHLGTAEGYEGFLRKVGDSRIAGWYAVPGEPLPVGASGGLGGGGDGEA